MKKIKDLSVLILDDEPLIALDIQDMLTELGCTDAPVFFSLRPTLESVQVKTYDLAILDVNLSPTETSIGLGRSLTDRGIPVIFASGGYSRAPINVEGFTAFLEKPFSTPDILAALISLDFHQ